MGSKSIVSWMGGKAAHAHRIIELFPEHVLYVEPFGGGGHVLCSKPPSQGEVYNDLDGDLVNFFRMARDRGEELQERLRWVPYSRAQFQQFRQQLRGNAWRRNDDLTRAVIWYSVLRQCFASQMASGSWGYTAWRRGKSGSWQPDSFCNRTDDLLSFRDRLRHVQIESIDFEDCIQRYDGDQALFYCDPPYVGTEGVYRDCSFGEADHRRLAELLHQVKGKVVLSYENHPLVDELYGGWRRVEFQAVRSSCKTRVGQKKKIATEVILCNW